MLPSGCGTASLGELSRLPFKEFGEHRDRAVELVADHAPREMLAGDLPALEVEGVAVAVVRRHAEHRHVAVVLDPAHLPVVRNVAPDQELADRVPGRTLGPQRPGPQALDGRVRLREAIERRIDRDDVRIPEIDVRRGIRAEIARRGGDRARRRDRAHRLLASAARAPIASTPAPIPAAPTRPRKRRRSSSLLLLNMLPSGCARSIASCSCTLDIPLPPWLNTGHSSPQVALLRRCRPSRRQSSAGRAASETLSLLGGSSSPRL